MGSKVQTKIQFAERKRFLSSSEGKENKIKIVKNSPSKRITKSNDSDSDDDFIISHKRIFDASKKTNDEECSPPKRNLINTPTQRMNQLTVKSSSKSPSPLKKQNHFSPKKLFSKVIRNEFHEAHKALHSSTSDSLPGREDKMTELRAFLLDHLINETPGTLYVSGPPGTGKTACLNIVMSDPQVKQGFQIAYVNCTSMKSANTVYLRICEELKIRLKGRTEKSALSAIEKYLSTSQRMILLVLDELDQLSNNKQTVLYSVFEWPSHLKSKLVLVGIANALDLTDRVLPRLKAHLQTAPELLHFPPYTRQQIVNIITERLSQADVTEVFSLNALQLLAGKVAAVSGDVRRALDMARRVVELAENKNVLQPINGDTKQTVALQEVMSVVSNVYNTAQCFDTSESESFPIQQKLLICSLLLVLQNSNVKDVSVGKLHDVYRRVCEKQNISSVDLSEFLSLTTLISARGLLKIVGKNHNRLSKVVLQWDKQEVAAALEDKQLLAAILSDKS